MSVAGFFGKLPSHGDFVSRRLSREFLAAWDPWLQQGIAHSQAQLGEAWLNTYLTSPIWRFVLDKGAAGADSCAGVMVPSVDRVGRYFPLTVMLPLEALSSPLVVAGTASDWFDEAERLLLTALEDSNFDLAEFDSSVENISGAIPTQDIELEHFPDIAQARSPWCVQIADPRRPDRGLLSLMDASLARQRPGYSVWWTAGSEKLVPCMLIDDGLPSPQRYTAMLDGTWRTSGWQQGSVAKTQMRDDTLTGDIPPPLARPVQSVDSDITDLLEVPDLAFRSAARSDSGNVRDINEDAYFDSPEKAVWVVADGMGGHSSGDVASNAIVDAVAQADWPGDLHGRILTVTQALQRVNRDLRLKTVQNQQISVMGSTVASMLAVDNACAFVWAGDTRVYRRRGDNFIQMTTDHSERQESLGRVDIATMLGPSNVVTRAVGGEDELNLSVVHESLLPGDRYLICSDGVYDELSVSHLLGAMGIDDCAQACSTIIDQVLAGRAADNVTAIIIDVISAQ